MTTPESANLRWYGQPGSRVRQVLAQLGGYDPDYNRVLWNATKQRTEWWNRCTGGTNEWVLWDVFPGRVWRDRFMAAGIFVAALLGFDSELPWSVNGRRGGAVAPDDSCFPPANEIGGGLNLTVVAGGQLGDYTAISWGGDYPVMLRKSPHYKITASPEQIVTCAMISGLVDSTIPSGTDDFDLPDNGVFFHFDTDIDALTHAIIRSGGVNVTNVTATPPAAGTHASIHAQTSDDGEHIRFLFQGNVRVDWVDISGAAYADLRAAQLKPYIAVVSRSAGVLQEFHAHDFRLIMDRGF